MLNLFFSKENKRIKKLFLIFKNEIQKGDQNDVALMKVWGELIMRDTQLKNRYGFQERNIESQKKLLKELFSFANVSRYDVFESIQFIIRWEFPQKYNKTSTINEIRSKKDLRSKLENKVKKIGSKILVQEI